MRKFLGMTQKQLGTILKNYRKSNGYTQQKIADYLGIERSTYAKYETSRKPDVDIVVQLSVLYNTSIDSFLSSFVEISADRSDKPETVSPLTLISSPQLSQVNDELLLPLSEDEKKLLLYYRSSLRKSEIIKKAYDILCDDVSAVGDAEEE